MNITILIISIISLFLIWQLWTYIKSKKLVGEKIPYDKLDEEMRNSLKDKSGLVYFYSSSCSHCKKQTPIINDISSRYENVLSINAYENMKIAKIFNVTGTPSMLFFAGNKIQGYSVGIKKQSFIIQKLESLL